MILTEEYKNIEVNQYQVLHKDTIVASWFIMKGILI